ncbi:hypothetical protein DFO70_1348 [Cytobacillus firmus]|uniref:Uncharacterized protein n=2 Tax=Cytobacillus TaxID=2675230 RepID=A0A366JHU3_CYTFI|nr:MULTISPECIES: hypothetical protein [Cytobacillus]RBP86060.1 hypothetical protein DFO70_1348 [Cytobacillus firmus]TDX35403.1 hypothetical protein DFO72_1308 [Cytobacillus oceanisediminis]
MNMLTPYIEKDLHNYYYPKIFKDLSPAVAPWKIEVSENKKSKWLPWIYNGNYI